MKSGFRIHSAMWAFRYPTLKKADEIVTHSCDANGFLSSLPPIGRDGIVKILHVAEGEKV